MKGPLVPPTLGEINSLMKSTSSRAALAVALIAPLLTVAQMKPDQSHVNKTPMETVESNKEVIRTLYAEVLNQKKFSLVDELVADDYVSLRGGKGPAGFLKGVKPVTDAFPDAEWTLEAIVAEGNSVMVKQTLKGTHKNQFQNIAPTGKVIQNDGFARYELKDGKIVRHEVLTDRLTFLQQLGVLPDDPLSSN